MSSEPRKRSKAAAMPLPSYRRIVVKLGTNLLTSGSDQLDLEMIAGLVDQIARLRREKREVLIVTSGAIAAGRHYLGEVRRVRHIPLRQVYAAVGQSRLMDVYDQLFSEHNITIAQTLLTKGDLQNRVSYLNARNTLLALMELGVVPIVNENDVVAVDELAETSFGDNDNLSALVANLVDADALVLLTDIDGLYTGDPNLDPAAKPVPVVTRIDGAIEEMAGNTRSGRARGGMITKIQAARLATASGVVAIIANGRQKEVLLRLVAREALGTLFQPTASKLESRKRWMLSGLSRRGALQVDDGAAVALCKEHRSLLPAGVSNVEGDFQRGDIVTIRDRQGNEIACGIVNYGAQDLLKVKGLRSAQIESLLGYHYGDEVVHRNNLMLL